MTNTIYCTYLTTYSGDKLPPLYIGSTSVNRINNGYHGSVSSKKYRDIWESELSENPDLFQTKILTTHETREEAFDEEIRYQIEHDVVNSDLYINMAVANGKLMFCDHSDLEYRKKKSEATKRRFENPEERKKQSEYSKGKKRTEETKKKMSESAKKRYENPEERKKSSEASIKVYKNPEVRKKLSEAKTGKKRKPFTEEARKNMSEAMKKRYENPEARKKSSEAAKKRRSKQ